MISLVLTRLKSKDMKAYTDLEQSKKLAGILPVESADAFYDMAEPEKRQVPIIGDPDDYYDMEDWTAPCWSLAALLDQLEDVIVDENGYNYQLQIIKEGVQYYLVYEGTDDFASYDTHLFDDLIDCCYEMIIKLKEKDLL